MTGKIKNPAPAEEWAKDSIMVTKDSPGVYAWVVVVDGEPYSEGYADSPLRALMTAYNDYRRY